MEYCLIEGGLLKEGPRDLPQSWHNISGLRMVEPAGLKALGWLPAVIIQPTFDDTTHKRGARSVSVGTDDVTFTWAVVELNINDNWENWKHKMAALDKDLPRYAEDIIDAMNPSDLAGLSQETKDKNAAKKLERGKKPPKPPEPEL
jgi:hypothetical protein